MTLFDAWLLLLPGSQPHDTCAVATQKPFHATLEFTPASDEFGFTVRLEQEGRSIRVGPVRYTIPPTKGNVKGAEEANTDVGRPASKRSPHCCWRAAIDAAADDRLNMCCCCLLLMPYHFDAETSAAGVLQCGG